MHRFLIVIEKANGNYSAYSPDLPGCIATGETREDAERNIHEAIQMHVQGLVEVAYLSQNPSPLLSISLFREPLRPGQPQHHRVYLLGDSMRRNEKLELRYSFMIKDISVPKVGSYD